MSSSDTRLGTPQQQIIAASFALDFSPTPTVDPGLIANSGAPARTGAA